MDGLIYREATSLLLSDFLGVRMGQGAAILPDLAFSVSWGRTSVRDASCEGSLPYSDEWRSAPLRKAAKTQLLFCPKTRRISGKNGVHFCPRKFLFLACVGREISGQFVGRQLLYCNHQAKESPLMVVGRQGTFCCTSLRRSPAISCRNPMRSPLGKRGRRLREC